MSDTKRPLMLLHDGELDALAAQQLAHRLAWDASAREYLAGLDTVGNGVRDAVHQGTPGVDLTDSIMARIASDAPRGLPPVRVRRWHWTRTFGSRFGVGLGSTAALAAAALLWVFVRVPADAEVVAETPRESGRPAVEISDSSAGVAIESVDFGGGGGSIFMVQGGRDTTPVVWLSEPVSGNTESGPL